MLTLAHRNRLPRMLVDANPSLSGESLRVRILLTELPLTVQMG